MNDSQVIDGVHLPVGETHMIEHMTRNRRLVDGRATYQYKKLEAALKLAKKRRLALDIGAHVGLWSMHLAKHFEHLIAFEPVPKLADLWVRNMSGITNTSLRQVALGNTTGRVDFQVPTETTGNAHVAIAGAHPGTRGIAHPDRIEEIKDVAMQRLDDLGLAGVDFIKIDVEGFEKSVLLGGEKLIRRDKPIIVIEQKKNEAAYGDEPNAALKLLQKWGAKIDREIGGDYLMRWEGCGCGDRRESLKRLVGARP